MYFRHVCIDLRPDVFVLMDISVLASDRHTNVKDVNQLMLSQPFLENLISKIF